jgi:hypothetical protein
MVVFNEKSTTICTGDNQRRQLQIPAMYRKAHGLRILTVRAAGKIGFVG